MRSGLQGTAPVPATLKKMNTKRNNTTHASTNGNMQQRHRKCIAAGAEVAVRLSGKTQHTLTKLLYVEKGTALHTLEFV